MSLYEKINGDAKSAMKSGARGRLEVLRFLLAQLQNFEKEKTAKNKDAKITDEETVALLQKEAKKRKEALELFRKGNRGDLVEKEEADLAVIYEYLPKELSQEEIEKIVEEVVSRGVTDFNSLMREAMKALKGRADGKTVGEIVKRKAR